MKKYSKPVVELSKFDVEDIITVSGESQPTAQPKSVYQSYQAAGGTNTNKVEFEW